MKRRSIIVSAALASTLGALTQALPVQAGDKKPVDQITCEDFLKMAPASQERVAYWVDGYQAAQGKSAIEVIEFDKFGQPIGEMVQDCKSTPKETLWQKLKKYL
jgi:HdeA/HdeB family